MAKRTALALILSAFLVLPAQGQSDTEREPATLTVSGRGEVRVAPNEATVRLGVSRQRVTAQEAQEAVNQVAQEILATVIQLGVEAEQIQTSELRLSPVYSTRRPGSSEEPRVIAYRASNMVSVRLKDLSLVGPTIDSAMESGGNQLQGVNFALRDDLAARQEASQKAKAISEALDLRLIEVSEGSVSIRVPAQRFEAARAQVQAASAPVSPGQLTESASVTIRYRIGK